VGVRIRPFVESDVRAVRVWLNDPAFRSEFLTFGRERDSIVVEKLGNMVHGSEDVKYLATERIEDSGLIGLLFYYRVPHFDYFEVGFYIVPEERGKGYGTEAMKQLVRLVFEKYNTQTIVAGTSSLNLSSQRALEKSGFKGVGTLRKTLFRNGQWEDSIIYQVLRD
jgi:RimJ/RimL family protein N-acetyltransferase